MIDLMRRSACLAAALLLAVLAAAFCVQPAWANGENTTAWGAQTQLPAAQPSTGEAEIDVVQLTGDEGDTAFFTVEAGGSTQAERLAHQFDSASGGSTATMVFRLQASLDRLDGYYHVTVFADRAGKNKIFSGAVYGVYASFEAGEGESAPGTKLIGTRTVGDGGYGSPSFSAPATLYDDGRAYNLVSPDPDAEGAVLTFHYQAASVDPGTIDGVVKYVDKEGNLLTSTPIVGLAYNGEPRVVSIPTAIEAEGTVYRTLAFADSVTASNPGQSSFTISCVEMSTADEKASGHYVENIKMTYQDEAGDSVVIASDSVTVKGAYKYTAPASIYKMEMVDGASQMVTYRLKGQGVLNLAPNRVLAEEGSHTTEILYERDALLPREVEVTFNLLNGQERAQANNKARILGTKKVTVSAQNATATPDAAITVDGTTYRLAGSADSYTYTYGSGAAPVVNAYYVSEDYVAPGPYEVTVNYVNLANNQVVASETFTSSPDDIGDMNFVAPESFVENGRTYVRLPGQEDGFAHNYWSNTTTYTVYYRDSEETLTNGAVITTVRVVYDEVPGQATGQGQNGQNANAAGQDANAAQDADAAANAQLNAAGTYNVLDGTGNQTLTNEGGVDSNTERIDDEATPLANIPGDQGAGSPFGQGGVASALPWIALIAAAVVVAGIILFLLRRRDRAKNARHAA